MTSLIAWMGGNRGINSVYLASDSRISWGSSGSPLVWDCGRKLFAARSYPEILGYCGDVLFPSQVLAQIIEHIDAGLLFHVNEAPQVKSDRIFSSLRKSFLGYPIQRSSQVSIIYCTRQNIIKKPIVYAWLISWNTGKWEMHLLPFPIRSDLILAIGSGETTI